MNSSNNTPAVYDHLYESLLLVDNILRYFNVIIHLSYLVILAMSKSLQKRTMLYIHHATITNSVYGLMMFFYIFSPTPATGSKVLDKIICSLSEILWVFATYIRMYSILLISIYRYVAVFKISLYKKLNDSYFSLICPILVIWTLSLGFPIMSKYIFNTTHSAFFCIDGYSPIFLNSILYFFFNYSLMVIVPSILVVIIYLKIILKLKSISNKVRPLNGSPVSKTCLNSRDLVSVEGVSATNPSAQMEKTESLNSSKQRRFANQFILMCLSVVLSALVLSIFTLRNVIPNYLAIFHYYRPPFRVYINLSMLIVPFLSIYYHPSRNNFKQRVLKFLRRNKRTT